MTKVSAGKGGEGRGGRMVEVPINHVSKEIRPKLLRLVQTLHTHKNLSNSTYVRIKSPRPGGSRNVLEGRK